MNILRVSMITCFTLMSSAIPVFAQDQPELDLIAALNDPNGFLWTSSFQRADGSTCAWIKVEEGQMTEVLYDSEGDLCRRVPSDDADVFEFTRAQENTVMFGGPDFVIERSSASMVSGSWNHVSRDTRFDLNNVVFRFLPTPTQ